MEFLLINHPARPARSATRAAKCDLQDQALFYGRGAKPLYREIETCRRRKIHGAAGQTEMTRCIHCTRCIRFGRRHRRRAGARPRSAAASTWKSATLCRTGDQLGAVGQPRRYLPGRRAHLAPLCVRGAAVGNSKKTESVDVMDAVGSNVRIDSRGAHRHARAAAGA